MQFTLEKTYTGLTANTKYIFKVTAINSVGSSTPVEKEVWTRPADVASLTASEPTVNSIKLTWDEVTPNTNI